MYSVLKDILKFFQDNLTLIIANIWVFLLFALIVSFLTLLICKSYYGKKTKQLNNKVSQIQEENENLKSNESVLKAEIRELNSKLEQYDIYRIVDKKKNKTNSDFAGQLLKDFSTE